MAGLIVGLGHKAPFSGYGNIGDAKAIDKLVKLVISNGNRR